MRVGEANSKLKTPHYYTTENHPDFLAPNGTVLIVDNISDETTCGSEDYIHKAEHCCPASRAGLSQLSEILQVVRAYY
jgi:hypothetical protein